MTPKASGDKQQLSSKSKAISSDARKRQADSVRLLQQELEERVTILTDSSRQLKRKIFDLYTIFEISRNFNSVLDFQSLLDTFVLTSLAQVGASKGAIYLIDRTSQKRYTFVKKRGSGDFPKKSQFFPHDSRLSEYLTKLNRPVLTSEIYDEIANPEERSILKFFHPGLIVPLIFQTELSGFLFVTDKVSSREFSMDDIEFLSILGSQISVAIENARLYQAEKEAMERLRATQEQLVNSERLAALGEMSAKIAHEINNPLGIIKNYILLLKRSSKDHPKAYSHAEVVDQEIDRIALIVRELLEFHRPRSLDLKRINIITTLEDVMTLMEQQIKKHGIVVQRAFEPDLPEIVASSENLKQVFINIILNACDAMTEGGVIGLGLRCVDNNLILTFCDTGPGIADEIIPRIFEPFFSTKESEKGTGLGLSVCYGIIKQHHGTITYKNRPTGGCFEINLPMNNQLGANE